ncbi:MAG: hypothetical protein AAGG02_21125 [Cyanobacteria bacterium P01_H01_bin.15]
MNQPSIECPDVCANGCVADERCPKWKFVNGAAQFISNTSLDQMIEIAEIARLKKLNAPPKWIIPEDF